MTKLIIWDIDGTLANQDHRATKHLCTAPWDCNSPDDPIYKDDPDWDAYYEDCHDDVPYDDIIWMFNALVSSPYAHSFGKDKPVKHCFMTGRPEKYRAKTREWLRHWVTPGADSDAFPLFMRPDDDHRPDHDVKVAHLTRLEAQGYIPFIAFEDRNSVVSSWRRNGVRCVQVQGGNF